MTSEPNILSSLGGPHPMTDADHSVRPGQFHPTQEGPGGLLVPECWPRPPPVPASFPCGHSGDPRLSRTDILLTEACPRLAPWEPRLPHRAGRARYSFSVVGAVTWAGGWSRPQWGKGRGGVQGGPDEG